MRLRSWPVVALALSGLLFLIGATGLAARRKAQQIHDRLGVVTERQQEIRDLLNRIQSDVHLSGNSVRDYLLDRSYLKSPYYRERLSAIREQTTARVEKLKSMTEGGEAELLEILQAELVTAMAQTGRPTLASIDRTLVKTHFR